jgi:hypothetical protein
MYTEENGEKEILMQQKCNFNAVTTSIKKKKNQGTKLSWTNECIHSHMRTHTHTHKLTK